MRYDIGSLVAIAMVCVSGIDPVSAQHAIRITPSIGVSHSASSFGSTTNLAGEKQDVRLRNAPVVAASFDIVVLPKVRIAADAGWTPQGDVQGVYGEDEGRYLAAKVRTVTLTGGVLFEVLNVRGSSLSLNAGFGVRRYSFPEVYHPQSGPWIAGSTEVFSVGAVFDLPWHIALTARDIMMRASPGTASKSTQHNLEILIGRRIHL